MLFKSLRPPIFLVMWNETNLCVPDTDHGEVFPCHTENTGGELIDKPKSIHAFFSEIAL